MPDRLTVSITQDVRPVVNDATYRRSPAVDTFTDTLALSPTVTLKLETDATLALDLPTLLGDSAAATGVHYVRMRSDESVSVSLTNTNQTGVWDLTNLVLREPLAPFTAISLTRQAGVDTEVEITLGQIQA